MKGIIAFCGSKGAGKSTSSDIFKQYYSGGVEEVALAGHLKEVTSNVFGIDMKYFLDPSLKEVELDTYIVLDKKNIEAVYKEFDVNDFSYDKHVRAHIGKVLTSPRKLLQYIGTELLHPIDPLIHVKKMLSKRDPGKLTLITDLRFLNEFEYLKTNFDNEFLPFYVKNSRAELSAESDMHPSEKELLLFKNKCTTIFNEGHIVDLQNQIKSTAEKLEK